MQERLFNETLSKIQKAENNDIKMMALMLLFSTKSTIPLSEEEFHDTAPPMLNKLVEATTGDYVSFIKRGVTFLFN